MPDDPGLHFQHFLIRVIQAWRDELFLFSWGSPNQYAVLLLLGMVPWEHLNSWIEAICFDSAPGNPGFPFNVRIHCKLYLCLCYNELIYPEEL